MQKISTRRHVHQHVHWLSSKLQEFPCCAPLVGDANCWLAVR